jgi:hypothetical protein
MRLHLAHKTLLTLVLIALFGRTASASVIGPVDTSTPLPLTLTDWASSLTFPKFDGTLGTLLSVEIKTLVNLDTQLTTTNDSGTPSSGNVRTEVFVTLSDPLHGFAQGTDTLWPTPPFSFSLDAGSAVTSPLLTAAVTSDGIYNALSANGNVILSEFTGAGNIVLPLGTFTQTLEASSGGNTHSSQVTHASADGTITFTFTPAAVTTAVPEPGTVTTLAAALLALGLFARKRLPHSKPY